MKNALLHTERTIYNEQNNFKTNGKHYLKNKVTELLDGIAEEKIVLCFYSRFYNDSNLLKDKIDYFHGKGLKDVKDDFINEVLNFFDDAYSKWLFYSDDEEKRVDIEIVHFYDSIEITFWKCKKYSTNTTGTGYSIKLNIVDKSHMDNVLNDINEMNVPQVLKQEYLDILDRASFSYEVDTDRAIQYVKDCIKSEIDSFLYYNEEDFKSCIALKDLGIVDRLKKHLFTNKALERLMDCFSFEFETKNKETMYNYNSLCSWDAIEENISIENPNVLHVKFCDERISTIAKNERIEYEIRCS